MPEANKLDWAELAKIAVTPWDLLVSRDDEVVFKEKNEAVDESLQDKVAVSRQAYIKPADVKEIGMTLDCPRFDHQISHGPGRTLKPLTRKSWQSWPKQQHGRLG